MAKDKICKPFLAISTDKFTVDTIEDMQSRKYLKIGDIVELNGYYTAGDGAGHKRKIEATDDGSGVQLANGLWAIVVHSSEVNVSWFGIRDDKNLEQHDELLKFSIYTDESKVYTIDFNNYSIMNTNTSRVIDRNTRLPALTGLTFKKPKHIKNLKIYNYDKYINGNSLIWFALDESTQDTEVIIENCYFQPYFEKNNTDFSNSAADGACFCVGFAGHQTENWKATKHSPVTVKNCKFEPCVSYIFALATHWREYVKIEDVEVEYVGLFLFPYANNIYLDNVRAIYRRDLHSSTRRLVTTCVHLETEIHNGTGEAVNDIIITNSSVIRNDTMKPHIMFKLHLLANGFKANNIKLIKCNHSMAGFGGNYSETACLTDINNVVLDEAKPIIQTDGNLAGVRNLTIKNTTLDTPIHFNKFAKQEFVKFYNCKITTEIIKLETEGRNYGTLFFENCEFNNPSGDRGFAIVRNVVNIDFLKIKNCECYGNTAKLVVSDCISKIYIDNLYVNLDVGYVDFIAIRDNTTTTEAIIRNSYFDSKIRNQWNYVFIITCTNPKITLQNTFIGYNARNQMTSPKLINSTIETTPPTTTELNTPYYTSKMEEQGILGEYYAYLDEVHEYEKQSNVTEGIATLNILEEPVLPKSVEDFAKEYNLI